MKNSSETGSGFINTIICAVFISMGASAVGLVFSSLYEKGLQWWTPEKYAYIFKDADDRSNENPENINPKTTNSCEPFDIWINEAYEYFQEGNTIFIDTRFENEYHEGHIKGAINIPKDQTNYMFNKIKDKLPLDGTYIFYCSAGCDSSADTADYFCNEGYKDGQILVLMEEYQYWIDEGYPTE